ncbi:MAG: ribosome-associated translation inhibitor RaiA [Gammaproteobacteria bacterium]|jgi:putative sigma-54 modulation protein|nr:ribosome-associated translation inhibitor RaiA [Gammaproteobacteria bacterium]MBT5600629.1 ribosome-associated translation inhibitor RaiA [Gammaproteobacteria bacterium]MBT6245113.1 ribosome-associated translation inhibitor RaiA [Gammaproteobacteria bacterium]
MHIHVSGHHLQISESLELYVKTKLAKLERHFQHIINTAVILSVEKGRQKAETKLHISGGEIFAEAESTNLYKSIDLMAAKLDRQIRKLKDKQIGHRHQHQ